MKFAPFMALVSLLALCACIPGNTPPKPVHSLSWESLYTDNPRDAVNTLVEPVWIDEKFGTVMREDIILALDHWNKALNGHLYFVIQGVIGEESLKYEESGNLGMSIEAVHYEDAPAGILGWVDEIGAFELHIVSDQLVVRDMTGVIMHEIGHHLGLQHIMIPKSLMYPYWNAQPNPPCIDEVTIQILSARYGWNWSHLNYCVISK